MADCSGVVGAINRLTLERELTQDANQQLGKIVCALDFPRVHSDQSLCLALERMRDNQLDVLAVVNRANVHKSNTIHWFEKNKTGALRDACFEQALPPSN